MRPLADVPVALPAPRAGRRAPRRDGGERPTAGRMYTLAMPRLEEVLAELAAVPGVRAAALGGFDGLLVDEAVAPVTVANVVAAGGVGVVDADDAAADPAGPVEDALITDTTVTDLLGHEVGYDLDGAIVELTHAWHAVQRACGEHLEAGPAREVIVVADGGVALARTVGARWFALVWAAPTVDLDGARVALRHAAERLSEVVA